MDGLIPSRGRLYSVCGLSVSPYARLTCTPARGSVHQHAAATSYTPSLYATAATRPAGRSRRVHYRAAAYAVAASPWERGAQRCGPHTSAPCRTLHPSA